MAQSGESNPSQDNEKTVQMTIVKALQEKVEEQVMMIRELRVALQQQERERKER